ncbi:sodium/hydrogen exchanger [Elysia marginata]|uniref:Sodium/hydrogen exchanger n=1 Tax=Elysia marginata TaxID=1093978 RepID=A0AAV4G0Z5_9GAST|nr:sodium/hydrogen exchanger [Elysia marginata]
MEQLAFAVLATLSEHVVALWRSRRLRLLIHEVQSLPRRRKIQLIFLLTSFLLSVVYVLHSGVNQSTPVNRSELAKADQTPVTENVEEEKPAELPPKGAAEEEHHSSLTIFFILLVVGAFIGLFLKLFKFGNWKNEEAFPPTVFFIVLLPPIIFEGGYNLHKAEVVFQFDLVESFAFGSLISAVDPVATLAIFQALDVDPILYMLVFGESMLNDAVSIVLTT